MAREMARKMTMVAACLVALVGLGYLGVSSIEKPVSTDLSVVGKGKPVLVLAYENYTPAGGDALNRLSRVMGDYDSRVDFIVADLGIPQGRAFADRHGLVNGQAMFFRQDGTPVQATWIPTDEEALRNSLDGKLDALESQGSG